MKIGKRRSKKILIVLLSIFMVSLTVVTCRVAYAYFKTKMNLYTVYDEDGSKRKATIGMQLSLLFDKINRDSSLTQVSNGYSLGIRYNVKLTDASSNSYNDGVTTVSDEDKTVVALSDGQYTDSDGNTVTVASGVYTATKSGTTIYTAQFITDAVYYTYNSNASWGSPSNPYLISDKKNLQNLSVLQNIGYFENLYLGNSWEKNNETNKYSVQNGKTFTEASSIPYFLVSKTDGTPATINCSDITFTPIGNDTYPFIGYVGGAFKDGDTTVNGNSSDTSAIYGIKVQTTEDQVDVGLFGSIGYLGIEGDTADGESFTGVASRIENLLLYDVQVIVNNPDVWEVIASHIFNFTNDENSGKLAHENHHIGIMSGHVEYAEINYISVYYSSENIAAIDLRHTKASESGVKANYSSVTGIMGYLYNMNSDSGNGLIYKNGINNNDVSTTSGGIGTGGGVETGEGRGYVTAKGIYNSYYTTYTNAESIGTRKNVPDEYSASNVGQEIWKFYKSGSTSPEYGVMIDKTGSTYTLHNHQTTPATNNSTYFTINGNNWFTYIIYDTVAKTHTAYDGSALIRFNSVDLYIYNAVSLKDGANLCTEYIRDRIIYGTSATGMYYFTDGVFTFSLSDQADVIEDTWNDDTPDTITVGQDDDDKWTTDALGEKNGIYAFVKQATTREQVNGGKLFIAYKDSSNNYHLVTLAKNSSYESGNGDNAVTTEQTQLSLVSDTVKAQLEVLYNENNKSIELETGQVLPTDWNDVYVFNVGASLDSLSLDQLKEKYSISSQNIELDNTNPWYKDDQATVLQNKTTVLNETQNIKNTYYVFDSTIEQNHKYDNFNYFLIGNSSQTVNISTLNNDISTLNSIYFEDDWTTSITSSSSPLSGLISNGNVGNAISQTELNYYDDGFFYFYTYNPNVSSSAAVSWYYKYYYIDSSGATVDLGNEHKQWYGQWDEILYGHFSSSSTSTIDGTKLYTYQFTLNGKKVTKTLPLLYKQNNESTYYSSYSRGGTYQIEGSSTAVLDGNTFCVQYNKTYNYVVAKLNYQGVQYYLNGTNTTCTNISKTGNTIKNRSNLNLGLYYNNGSDIISKDYALYDFYVGTTKYTGFMLTKYSLDGYFLKSQTGTGITYKLNNSVTTLTSSGILMTVSGLPSGMTTPPLTLTLAGKSFQLYTTDNLLGVRVANYNMDGYILGTIGNISTSFTLNNDNGQSQNGITKIFKEDDDPTTPDIVEGSELTIKLNGNEYNLYKTAQGKLAVLFYAYNPENGYYKFYHSNPDNINDPFVLRLLFRDYPIGTDRYSVMSSTNAYAENGNNFTYGLWTPTVTNSTYATVTFNNDGSAYISYTVNGTTRYLNYSESGNYFNTSTSATKLYLFTVVGTRKASVSNQIIPVNGTEVGTYSADQYVLYPNSTIKNTTDADGNVITSTSVTTSDDPTYSLYSLDYLANNGWNNDAGGVLTKETLHKRFSLAHEISWGATITLFNGSWNLGSDGINNSTSIVAPIGTNGAEANIPKGCIAFKINDSGVSSYKVRVIVSIPTSIYYPTQGGYDLETSEDYYFGLWQTEGAGESLLSTFEKSNSTEKFELPRSHAYMVDADPATNDYVTITMGGNTYRAYLHGKQILVAYAFEVTDPGVYVLGATNGPMQIVYFSVDSTASTGRDGVTSYKMGTIDFVYSNNNRVVTIKDTNDSPTGSGEDYQYYYPSLAIFSTNNQADAIQTDTDTQTVSSDSGDRNCPNINDFTLYIRRRITDGDTEIYWRAESSTTVISLAVSYVVDAEYLEFTGYSIDSDNITRVPNQARGGS